MTEALKHLASLETGQWHNLNDIPKDLFDDAWKIIDEGLLDGYRFTLHEVYSYLVMKTKRADKENIRLTIEQIKRDYQSIDWLWCKFSDNAYIMEVRNGIDRTGVITIESNTVFHPFIGKKLNDPEVLDFLYKHCVQIKIVYLKEEPKNV